MASPTFYHFLNQLTSQSLLSMPSDHSWLFSNPLHLGRHKANSATFRFSCTKSCHKALKNFTYIANLLLKSTWTEQSKSLQHIFIVYSKFGQTLEKWFTSVKSYFGFLLKKICSQNVLLHRLIHWFLKSSKKWLKASSTKLSLFFWNLSDFISLYGAILTINSIQL